MEETARRLGVERSVRRRSIKACGLGGPVRRLTTVVALLHPSGYNLGNNLACRRYRGYTGMDAELELLREANALAKGERSP